MSWVRLDDGYPEHPKVEKVGPLAAWLNVCAWAYSARNLTDGFVPHDRIGRLASVTTPRKLAARLVAVNLWEEVSGGYRIHDYLEYNPSREQVLKDRASGLVRANKSRTFRRSFGRNNGARSPDPAPAPVNNAAAAAVNSPVNPTGENLSRAPAHEASATGFQHIGALLLPNGTKTAAAAAANSTHFEVTDELRAEHERRLEQERRARS